MPICTLADLQQAQSVIYREMAPTAQYCWPLLCEAIGTEVWLKHENHTPTGSFKARGAITFIDWLVNERPDVEGIVTATRGNHGQSQARAASRAGLKSKIVVPHGNSVEKNASMRAFGAEVITFGKDFDESKLEAARIAESENLFPVAPFHPRIVQGVASYGLELMQAVANLDEIYIPVGCGSGLCGTILARDLLGLDTRIVGVVSQQADAVKQSYEAGHLVSTDSAQTFADGVAVRQPLQEAYDIYADRVDRFVAVSEQEIADTIRLLYLTTHNIAEGAGAVALAGLIQDKQRQTEPSTAKVAAILTGSNIDTEQLTKVLQGGVP